MFLQYTGMGASETREIPHPWVNQTYFQRLGNTSANPLWRYVSDGNADRYSFSYLQVTCLQSLKPIPLRQITLLSL